MPRAKENLKIEITQSTTDEIRNIQITINVPVQEFLLSDLLSQRGAVTTFEAMLKQAVKSATEDYLARTEELIAGIAGGQKVNTSSSNPGLKSISKEPNSNVKKRADSLGEKLVKPQIPEPVIITSATASKGD
jgi:hypothetical protein